MSRVSIEGHRGARGHLPENTVPSFIRALELGADTLELDVVISADREVVVSHEPWFSSAISLDAAGMRIAPEQEKEHNIFTMPYDEVRRYDVGSLGHPGFPGQAPLRAHKPLLFEVFTEIDRWAANAGVAAPHYNIELKSAPEGDELFHPKPDEFAELVLDVVRRHEMVERSKLQAFDVRPLQSLRRLESDLRIAVLIAHPEPIDATFERLGFLPYAFSPIFFLANEAAAAFCRTHDVRLVPWTVNEFADLERMKAIGVDGVITDFPDRAVRVFRSPSA